MLSNYKKVGNLGRGTYSTVSEYKHKQTQKSVAVKKYLGENEGLSFDMIREVGILNTILSSGIIQILDVDYTNFNHVIMPKYKFTLSEFIQNYKYGEKIISQIFYNICYGVYQLHSAKIVHRDLKPRNILVDIDQENQKIDVVIIDVGLSKYMISGRHTPKIASLYYRAPEIVAGYKHYDSKIDIWSLGCILLEMNKKQPIFKCDSEMELVMRQFKMMGTPNCKIYENFKEYKFKSVFHERFFNLTEGLYNLAKNMLVIDPKNRYNISDCLNINFLNQGSFFTHTSQRRIDYLKEVEWPYNYIGNRVSEKITFRMRKILLEWLFENCKILKLSNHVYFQTVFILDKYLILEPDIHISQLELIGCVCLWISSKFLSVNPVEADELEKIADRTINFRQLENMEKNVMKTLQFRIFFPLMTEYVTVFGKELCLNSEQKNEIIDILYKITLNPNYLEYNPYFLVNSSISYVLNYDTDYSFRNLLNV